MPPPAAMRYRVKGTRDYVPPYVPPRAMAASASTATTAAPEAPYEGIGTGRRAIAWRPGMFGPNAAINYGLDGLRNKSRDQVRKNGIAAAAVDRLVTNVVGTGIKPRSEAPDATFRERVQQLWLEWTDQADAAGALDFYGLQALAFRGTVEGGEAFVRLRTRRPEDGLRVPLQLQVIEGEHCPHMKVERAGTNTIRAGIEFNPIGARVAYHFYREHPGDGTFNGALGLDSQQTVRVPAEEVAHLYQVSRPGLIRGEPWLTRALEALRDLDAYRDAELVRHKTAALFVGVLKRQENAGPEQFPMGEGEPEADGTSVLALEPGTIQIVPDGYEMDFSKPPEAGATLEPFVRWQLRAIAAAVGILYEHLSGDYGQLNDRTLRAALNGFYRRCEQIQHMLLVFQMCRPVWRRWVDLAIFSGALTPPAGMAPADVYRVRWIPQAWPYIHPVQDVEAGERAVKAGFTSRSEEVNRRGEDAERVDRENQADNDRADQLGLSYTSDGRNAAKGGADAGSGDSGAAGGRGESQEGQQQP